MAREDGGTVSLENRTPWVVVAPLASYLFVVLSIRLANTALYPLFDAVFPFARDLNVGTGVLAGLALVAAALHRPGLLHARTLGAGAVTCALAGAALMSVGLVIESPTALCMGAVMRAVGTAWTSLLASMACCTLAHRHVLIGVPTAYLAANALAWAALQCGGDVCLTLLALCPLLSYLFARTHANPLVEEVRQAPAPSDARLARPASYLPLTNRMFVCMLLATAAMGFNLRIGPVEGGSTPWAAMPVFAILMFLGWLAERRGVRPYDTAFRIGVTFAVGAFLVLPLPSYLPLAQDLLTAAGAFFDAVFAVVLIAAATRNRLSAVSVLTWGSLMPTLGSIVGANLGAFVATGIAGEGAFLISAAVACALVAYVLIGLSDFSFADTIAGIEPVRPLEVPNVPDARRFENACAHVAQAHGLTPRETEVLTLLARGRNNAFVQEELTLTRNTVKTYIKRIYAKLGIHSQQELIDLVEEG